VVGEEEGGFGVVEQTVLMPLKRGGIFWDKKKGMLDLERRHRLGLELEGGEM